MTTKTPAGRAAACAALILTTALFASVSTSALACACGCSVFDVGSSSLFPTAGSGGQMWAEFNSMDQNRNWGGNGPSAAANNDDKEIRTQFYTLGGEYMFNHRWGVMVEAPLWDRTFKTDIGGGTIGTFNHTAVGDVRIEGMYTGFSHDMSTGITFGLKLPTGDFKYANFDRDTEIGTGSTDLLLGAFHRGPLNKDETIGYFVQANIQKPLASQDGYTPGAEGDAAAGVYYNGWSMLGGTVHVRPIAQLIVSERGRDFGPAADPVDSGYSRALVSPGIEVSAANWKLYGDVELPIYQHTNGNQLIAPQLFKLVLSRTF